MKSNTKKPGRPLVESLSPRETQVADWIWLEAGDKQIGSELGVAPGTLRTHIGRIMRKLGVKTRTGIALAWERSERRRVCRRK